MGRWGGRDQAPLHLNVLDGAMDDGFNEADHPRDHGKFASGSGGASAPSATSLMGAVADPDKFTSMLTELETMPKEQVQGIMKELFGTGNISRPKAIAKLRSMHNFVMQAKKKRAAFAGKVAG